MSIDAINKRRYPRVSTSFPCSFSIIDTKDQMVDSFGYGSQPYRNARMIVTAKILDISEGGIFADNIIAFNPETEKEITRPETIGHKLDDIKFRLNGNPKLVETSGEYVRQCRDSGRLSAAIQFKGISKDDKDMIRKYINS